jgi:hypothetical protein
MKHFARIILLTLSLGLAAIALSFYSNHPASAAGGPTVTVTPLPLPVTGSVNAAVTGTVGVTGGPVAVSNVLDASSNPIPVMVRDADNPARQPFYATVSFFGTTTTIGAYPLYTVPAGKRAVVETVETLSGQGYAATMARIFFEFTPNAPEATFDFTTPSGTAVTQPTKFYAGPGPMGVQLYSTDSNTNLNGVVSISGYLIDIN